MHKNAKNEKGFTLVELSIVIVIIGLIVAGVTAGQSLVKQSKLRSVQADATNLMTAVNAFRVTYGAPPGDIKNAYDFWGSALSCSNGIALHSTANNCNGNGDGMIDLAGGTDRIESFKAMQQMAYVGMIPGTYTGKGISTTSSGNNLWCNPGENSPKSSMGGAFFFQVDFGDKKNYLELGSKASYSDSCWGMLLIPADVYSIDKKFDDGFSNTGKIQGYEGEGAAASSCTDGTNYAITQTAGNCQMRWLIK